MWFLGKYLLAAAMLVAIVWLVVICVRVYLGREPDVMPGMVATTATLGMALLVTAVEIANHKWGPRPVGDLEPLEAPDLVPISVPDTVPDPPLPAPPAADPE